jgi:HSP20 family protein
MRTLAKYDPFTQLERTSSLLDEMLTQAWRPFNTPFRDDTLFLPIDIWEKEGFLKVKAAVTGIAPKDVQINVEGGVLTITGESRHEQEINEAKVYRRECTSGRVTRSIRLPDHVDMEKGEAEFENGFVTVSFPIKEASQPKTIEVKRK